MHAFVNKAAHKKCKPDLNEHKPWKNPPVTLWTVHACMRIDETANKPFTIEKVNEAGSYVRKWASCCDENNLWRRRDERDTRGREYWFPPKASSVYAERKNWSKYAMMITASFFSIVRRNMSYWSSVTANKEKRKADHKLRPKNFFFLLLLCKRENWVCALHGGRNQYEIYYAIPPL